MVRTRRAALPRDGGVRGGADRAFDAVLSALLLMMAAVVVFPLLFVVSASVTPHEEVIRNGGFLIVPRVISLDAYGALLRKSTLGGAFQVTAFVTLVGTLFNVVLTGLTAYPLSKKNLPGRKLLVNMVVLTLMFNGGIVPTYLVVKDAGLINTPWALIVPQVIWSQYLIILKNFMERIPEELLESARIDGASEIRTLWSIVTPLCVPILITVAIYYGVAHWNEFQQAILYITQPKLWPLQVIVRDILTANQQVADPDQAVPTMTLQMASVVIASLPIAAVYPFIQKFYVTGITSGAVKG